MFLTTCSMKKPKKNFNLLHLESAEIYIMSLQVALLVDIGSDPIKGKLHLCSRSLVFEPKSIDNPLIKVKYSNNLALKHFAGIEKFKIKDIPFGVKNITGASTFEGFMEEAGKSKEKGLRIGDQETGIDPSLYHNNLIKKIYFPGGTSSKTGNTEKLINGLFVRVDKLYLIYRNPLTPYITEKCNEVFIFDLSKTNTKVQVQRFFKIYYGLIKAVDESEFLQSLISTTVSEGIKEFKELKKEQKENVTLVLPARQITVEGPIYGLFSIINEKRVLFYPVLNNPYREMIDFNLTDVKSFLKYRYMFKKIGIEIWRHNKNRSLLFVFDNEESRNKVASTMKNNSSKLFDYGTSKEQLREMWINGAISNFEYLMMINAIANRSFNDLSQYPIFPWVLGDYTSQEIDLNDPAVYRDLSKPVGAINKHRLQKYKDLYELKKKDKSIEAPYLYSTHYSTPGFVVYYLIRKIPEFVIKLQNGVFGPTDRIFRSVESTWYSTISMGADFKELIPEFYMPNGDYLVNNERIELGVTQEGDVIDDVQLPPWAESNPEFISKMRAALESDYVSSNLNHWIDLIFGCKQSGESALKADNVFYPLTYEENVNWESFRSSFEVAAMEVQVAEFGQTPLRIFTNPHPQRRAKMVLYSIGAKNQLMEQDKGALVNKLILVSSELEKLKKESNKGKVRKEENLD